MSTQMPWWRIRVGLVARLVSLASVVALVMGLIGRWWVFDLAAHFPLYCGLASMGTVPLVWRSRPWLLLSGLGIGLSLVRLTPLIPWKTASPGEIRVGVFNVLTSNHDREPAARWLASADLDVLCAIEVDHPWTDALGEHMSVSWSIPRRDNFGVALLVGSDVDVVSVRSLQHRQIPMIEAELRTRVGALDVLVMHTMPPMGGEATANRDAHLEVAARWIADRQHPAVVCGDLNITRWSAAMAPLLSVSDDAREGFGHFGTWTLHGAVPLGLPIDHVLPRGLVTTAVRSGPDLGSDHLPLVVDLSRGYQRRGPE